MVAAAPLVRGFVGVSLPTHQRGMANGFLQAGWSLGLAVGAALAGFLGDHLGLAKGIKVMFVFPLAAAAPGLIVFRANYRMWLQYRSTLVMLFRGGRLPTDGRSSSHRA